MLCVQNGKSIELQVSYGHGGELDYVRKDEIVVCRGGEISHIIEE